MHVPNPLYPVFLQLQGKKVLVVGGGTVAERKIRSLLPTAAQVHVGAPELTPALSGWVESGAIRWLPGVFEPAWMDQAWLVIAATDDRQVNAAVRDTAVAQQIWINVVDDPDLAEFQVPAVVDRAPLTIAISSGGHAPVLARRLRERLESVVDHGIGRLAALLAEYRPAIRAAYPDLAQRRLFYDWTLDGPVLARVSEGKTAQAQALLEQVLQRPESRPRSMLTLLAAPTADPGLLTLKGLRALHEADAVLYDPAQHAEEVVTMARRDAERLPLPMASWQTAGAFNTALEWALAQHGRVVVLVDTLATLNAEPFSSAIEHFRAQDIPVLEM